MKCNNINHILIRDVSDTPQIVRRRFAFSPIVSYCRTVVEARHWPPVGPRFKEINQIKIYFPNTLAASCNCRVNADCQQKLNFTGGSSFRKVCLVHTLQMHAIESLIPETKWCNVSVISDPDRKNHVYTW
jgi:hypothetical protein